MLHIIYRTRGGEDTRAEHKPWRHHKGDRPAPAERTEWFDKRIYFKSFAREVDEDVRVTVVYDGDKPLLRDYILCHWIDRHPGRFTLHQIYVGEFTGGALHDRDNFRSLISRGIRLWRPIPGYSTHDRVKRLSPLVDWRTVREALSL